jgi:hypothetical protein
MIGIYDIVMFVNERSPWHGTLHIGQIGKVVNFNCGNVGAQWQGLTGSHNCNGLALEGTGLYVYKDDVRVIKRGVLI